MTPHGVTKLRARRLPAFSLVEMVMVVAIIGVIAAIAVPRLSAAAENTNSKALQATLANVRKAIDVYYAEHGKYPGYNVGTGLPEDAAFVDQLLMYSDYAGKTNAAPTAVYEYGPYLRSPFPLNPSNDLNNVNVKATPGVANPAPGTVGWIAVLSHGYFGISASNAALDDLGVKDIRLKKAVRVDSGL